MDDAALVRRCYGVGDLAGNREGVAQRCGPFSNALRQRRAFDQFQDQRLNIAACFARPFPEAVDRGDMSVVE